MPRDALSLQPSLSAEVQLLLLAVLCHCLLQHSRGQPQHPKGSGDRAEGKRLHIAGASMLLRNEGVPGFHDATTVLSCLTVWGTCAPVELDSLLEARLLLSLRTAAADPNLDIPSAGSLQQLTPCNTNPVLPVQTLDATSNEPWGPHGQVMNEIARATRNL